MRWDRSTAVFVALLIIPATFYTLATFLNLVRPSANLTAAIALGIGIAAFEYGCKIPIVQYGHNHGLSPTFMQGVWIVLTLLLAVAVSRFVAPPTNTTAQLEGVGVPRLGVA